MYFALLGLPHIEDIKKGYIDILFKLNILENTLPMVLLKILIKLVLKIKSLKIIMGNILGNSDLLNNSIDSMVLSTMMFLLKNISKKFNLVNSIANTLNTLISIFGIVTFFNIINNLLPIKHPLITGIFEITNGLNLINKTNITYKYKLIYTAILMSFSGLSIITQIKSIFNKENTLNFSLFYKSRIIHLILFIILIYILY